MEENDPNGIVIMLGGGQSGHDNHMCSIKINWFWFSKEDGVSVKTSIERSDLPSGDSISANGSF